MKPHRFRPHGPILIVAPSLASHVPTGEETPVSPLAMKKTKESATNNSFFIGAPKSRISSSLIASKEQPGKKAGDGIVALANDQIPSRFDPLEFNFHRSLSEETASVNRFGEHRSSTADQRHPVASLLELGLLPKYCVAANDASRARYPVKCEAPDLHPGLVSWSLVNAAWRGHQHTFTH
jgi:hypothetical protein